MTVKTIAMIPTSLLTAAGYIFHEGADANGAEVHWFSWPQATQAVIGNTYTSFDYAATEALQHWLRLTHPKHGEALAVIGRLCGMEPLLAEAAADNQVPGSVLAVVARVLSVAQKAKEIHESFRVVV
jgi:hypothetical protein